MSSEIYGKDKGNPHSSKQPNNKSKSFRLDLILDSKLDNKS